MDRLLTFFGVERGKDEETADVFPLGMAPFIRLSLEGQEGGRPALMAEDGMFGLLPNFATEVQFGRRTYNARSETVDKLASFRQAWAAGQRCIVPAEAIYEPCYESGSAMAHRPKRRRSDGHRRHLSALAQSSRRRVFHVRNVDRRRA